MDDRLRDSETPQGPATREPLQTAAGPLKAAVRRGRVEEAERSEVLAALRGAEIARLEMLEDALQSVLAELPADVDLFDIGLMPSAHPRLFIDMIGFVEMGHDRRLYRFLQDTRHGRVTLAESEKLDVMVKAVTDYIARRLVEREKALAADHAVAEAERPAAVKAPALAQTSKAPKPRQGFREILAFTVDLFVSMLLFALVATGCYYILMLLSAWSSARH